MNKRSDNNNLAPIAVFAYNRVKPLKVTLEALARCPEFTSSRVTVFCDGARSGNPTDERMTAGVREYVRTWCDSHGAQWSFSERNSGLRSSITGGVSGILENSETVIVLEDDIVVSPAFLSYMNCMLDKARNLENICQVSGYMIPHEAVLPAIGLLRVPACWGWGTWRRAWKEYDDDAVNLAEKISGPDIHAFNINGSYDYFSSLEANASGKVNTWMVRWYASVFVKNMMTIYPARSYTRNIGHDVGGTHCGPGEMARVFNKQEIAMKFDKLESVEPFGAGESRDYVKAMEEFYRWQARVWSTPSFSDRLVNRLKREWKRFA